MSKLRVIGKCKMTQATRSDGGRVVCAETWGREEPSGDEDRSSWGSGKISKG